MAAIRKREMEDSTKIFMVRFVVTWDRKSLEFPGKRRKFRRL